MSWWSRSRRSVFLVFALLVAPALAAGVLNAVPAAAQTNPLECGFTGQHPAFPQIPLCAYPGAWQDSTLIKPFRCPGSFKGPLADSLREQPRSLTLRFWRDRKAEARPDFGGYRIYRVTNSPDSTRMVLVRRFSRQSGDAITWNFSIVDTATLQFKCAGQVVHDSIVTFVDPDSNGNYVKQCRVLDHLGRCLTRGDSVFRLVAPPGPHDGFRTWYAITYEARNTTLDGQYEDMFIPDKTGAIGPCLNPADSLTCPNLNNKLANLTPQPAEPTGGPRPDLERVAVVPNPFRAFESWDRSTGHEVHFINLPQRATVKIYTLAGDLVAELEHRDTVRDFLAWDLKNAQGRDIASGIYLYRVESDLLDFQDRFVVIR